MKKFSYIGFGFVMAVCFFMVFSYAFEKTRKTNQKVTEIHAASEMAIMNYLKSSTIPPVTYLIFFFDGNSEPAKAFSVSNNLQLGFKMYIQDLRNTFPWSREEFERVRRKKARQYPSTLSLWRGLKEEGEGK